MVDAELVTARLRDLALRIRRVRRHCPSNPEELADDQDALDLVSFNLMLAVQACLDTASHVIADEGWEPATTSAESFQRLQERAVISKDTAAALGLACGLRNIVAHEYSAVQPGLVHQAAVHGISDLERFAREVSRWISGRLEQ